MRATSVEFYESWFELNNLFKNTFKLVVNYINFNYESRCATLNSFYFEKLVEIDINQIDSKFIYKIGTTVQRNY